MRASSARNSSVSSAFGQSRFSSDGGPGQDDDDAAVGGREQESRRGSRQAERARSLRQRRLLRHPRREVGVRALEPLRRPARDGFDLPLEALVDAEADAGGARDHLDGAVVVGRAETAGDEARLRLQPLPQRRLELLGSVADDRDPRRLQPEAERLPREERPVQVGALAAHELAARDDDEGPGAAQPPASAVRFGVTTTRRFLRAGSATALPPSRTRSPEERFT